MNTQPLFQSEAEWLATGHFIPESVSVLGKSIQIAHTKVLCPRQPVLVTMVGGIPRETDKRQNLPLINKLYGYLAILLAEHGIVSLLYNQPATGRSGGVWEEETLHTRTKALAALVKKVGAQLDLRQHILIGSSAGAYLAVKALPDIQSGGHDCARLLLLSPAAYPAEAERVPYGADFTALLRADWSPAESPVFPLLSAFLRAQGEVLLSFYEADDPPIPVAIQEQFRSLIAAEAATGAAAEYALIAGVAHNFRHLAPKKGESVVDNQSIRLTARRFLHFLTRDLPP